MFAANAADGAVDHTFLTSVIDVHGTGAVGLQVLREVNERTERLIKLQRKIEAYRQVQHDPTGQLYSVASAFISSDAQTLESTLRQINQFWIRRRPAGVRGEG
jgi:hypothetical protein